MTKTVKSVSVTGILKIVMVTVAAVVFAAAMGVTSFAATKTPRISVKAEGYNYYLSLDDVAGEGLYTRTNTDYPVTDDFVTRILFYSTNGGNTPIPAPAVEGKEPKASKGSFTANKYTTYSEFKSSVLNKLIESGGQLVLIVAKNSIVVGESGTADYITFPKIGGRPKAPAIAANYVFDDHGDVPARLYADGITPPKYNTGYYTKYPSFAAVAKGYEGAKPAGYTVGEETPYTIDEITPAGVEYAEVEGDVKTNSAGVTYDLLMGRNRFPINTNATTKEKRKSYLFREEASYSDGAAVLPHAAGKTVTLSPTFVKPTTLKVDYAKAYEGIAISSLKDSVLYLGTAASTGTLDATDTYAAKNTLYDVGSTPPKTFLSFTNLLKTGTKTDVGIFKKATAKSPRSELQVITLLPRRDAPARDDVVAALKDPKAANAKDLEYAEAANGESVDSATKWGALPASPNYAVKGLRFAVRYKATAEFSASIVKYFSIDNFKDTGDKKYKWDFDSLPSTLKN